MAQTDDITSSITWTEIVATGGNSIKPTAGTNYKVTGIKCGKNNLTEYATSVDGSNTDNLWIHSGTVLKTPPKSPLYSLKSDSGVHIQGAKYLTILGDPESTTGPYLTGAFRGNLLQEDKDTSVYIYGGSFYNKVSAISIDSTAIKYTGTVSERTAHMYIYGASSLSGSVTGIGMATSGEYTANTDIQVLGKISPSEGVFGGISGDSTGCANLHGNTSITVSGNGKLQGAAFGGNRMKSDLTGNTSVNIIDNATAYAVLGGNFVANSQKNGVSNITGNVNITVKNATVGGGTGRVGSEFSGKGIYGGGVNTSVSEKVKIDISDNSTLSAGIIAGSIGWGTSSINKTELNISDSTITATNSNASTTFSASDKIINDKIYGGSVAIGTSTYTSNADVSITNGTVINIAGGNITSDIFGGGYAQGASDTYYGKTTVNGGTQINIDVKSDTTIVGNIYAGGNQGNYGESIVNDGAKITLKNANSNNLTFDGIISGTGLNGAVVNGSKEFNFDSYMGAFNGSIANFDNANVMGSDVLFNGTFSDVSNLTIFENAVLTVANSSVINGVNVVNNGKLIIADFDTTTSTTLNGDVEVKVEESLSISLSSDENFTINSVTNVAETEAFVEIVESGDFVAFDAFDFDIDLDLATNETVTLSFYVDKEGLTANNFVIYHEENGEWSVADDVSNVKYEDGYLTFDVTHFSGYGYVIVPEPAHWATIFGILALGFVAYRRKK